MQWQYITPQRDQKAVDESQLPDLVNQGVIHSDTLLWNETLTDWTPASKAKPDLFGGNPAPQLAPPASSVPVSRASSQPGRGAPGATAAGNNDQAYKELARTLSKASGWLRFLGVLNFIGFIYIITVFVGIKCFSIANAADAAARSGDYSQLRKAVKDVAGLFILQGVFALIIMAIYVVIILIAAANA